MLGETGDFPPKLVVLRVSVTAAVSGGVTSACGQLHECDHLGR